MTLFAHFCGLLSRNIKRTFPAGTPDLVLLRSHVDAVVVITAVLGGFKTKTTSWAHFRRPSSSSSRSRPRPRSKNQPGPAVVLCCTHHTLQQLEHTAMAAGFIGVHRRRPSQHQQQQLSSSQLFFFPSDENRNDFRLSSALVPSSFPNHTYRKIDLLLVDHFPFSFGRNLFFPLDLGLPV